MLQTANLSGLSESTMWRQVNDFGWHRVQHSPNWSVLPEDARIMTLRSAAVSVRGAPTAATVAADISSTSAADAAPLPLPADTSATLVAAPASADAGDDEL
jgi:hypothetical protein